MSSTPGVRLAVITMVQSQGFPIAWTSLKSLSPQLSESRQRFILLNDAPDAVLEAELAQLPFTKAICAGENLGVAPGRNELIRAAIDWGADIIASVDDDLLFPDDYLEILQNRFCKLVSLRGRVGIVGPVVLDYEPFSEAVLSESQAGSVRFGEPVFLQPMVDLRIGLSETWKGEVPERAVYHAGIRDWAGNYLRFHGDRAGLARRLFDDALEGPRLPVIPRYELRREPSIRDAVLEPAAVPVRVDTLPGGACMYSSALVREIGAMDEAFSPFGFEDADFAIRSVEAGYKNFVLPEVVAVHDIAHRGRRRDVYDRLFVESRSRALIASKHTDKVRAARVAVELAALSPLRVRDVMATHHTVQAEAVEMFVSGFGSYLAGWLSGATVTPDDGSPMIQAGWNEASHPIALKSWSKTPSRGLPVDLQGVASVALNWDPTRGVLDVRRLGLDIPGLGVVSAGCRIVDIEDGAELTLPSFEPARLERLWLDAIDNGGLRRLEETVAWRRTERTDGYLAFFAERLGGRRGSVVRRFLAPAFRGPASIRISVTPRRSITFGEMWSLSSESLASDRPPAFDVDLHVGEPSVKRDVRSKERGHRWIRST